MSSACATVPLTYHHTRLNQSFSAHVYITPKVKEEYGLALVNLSNPTAAIMPSLLALDLFLLVSALCRLQRE